jgi:hypothetical protein
LLNADFRLVRLPKDSSGNYCGAPAVNNTVSNLELSSKPYLYYFNPINPVAYPSICVAACPATTTTITPNQALCNYGLTPTLSNIAELIATFQCAPIVIASKPVLGRCVPVDPIPADVAVNILKAVNADAAAAATASVLTQASDVGLSVVNDISKAWPYLVGAVFLALVISFVWLYLLRFFAKPMVWLMIIGVNLMLAGLAGFCYYYWQERYNYYMFGTDPGHNLEQVKWEYISAQVGFYVFVILFGLMVIITIALRKKIMIACEIVKEASRAVGTMPFISKYFLCSCFSCIILIAKNT